MFRLGVVWASSDIAKSIKPRQPGAECTTNKSSSLDRFMNFWGMCPKGGPIKFASCWHWYELVSFFQKNPRAHKDKIGTYPPPPKNSKYPPLKRGSLWALLFLQNGRIFPGAHQIGATISGPRIAGKQFCGHEDFSEF